MKPGLEKSALLLSFAFGFVGLSGCKTPPFCEPLGACGGDLLNGATDFANQDGLVDREWTVTGANACQDQLQVPPVAVSLVRQPPVPANVRPPDNVTADWCGNLVLKADGEVKEFIVYAPPLPIKVGLLTMSADYDMNTTRGTYVLGLTVAQNQTLHLSESCLTAQGIRDTCPELGRRLGEFLKDEANLYEMRCQNPSGTQGGCDCFFEETFITGSQGRWSYDGSGKRITFFDSQYAPPATADYCLGSDGSLDLTGTDYTPLFNQKSQRTMHMQPPSCSDGIQSASLGETGVDCGGQCPAACGTCSDGIANGDEDGIDCGGSCLGILCDPDTTIPREQRKASCADGKQEPWEEGVDCGGPCTTECSP